MKNYIVHYETPGMMTFAPMFAIINADSEEQAREIFKEKHQNDEILHVSIEEEL